MTVPSFGKSCVGYLVRNQVGRSAVKPQTGKKASKKHGNEKPDAIILDMSMPQLDGMETAGILQRLMPTVQLIMFTNFSKDNS